ncbi:hypothetical protein Hamer_G007286 [Homarus americanus]|uniref:Uncharacterized protein n=1 Tax=Homarus americanus TaxID=6706 RepID=A0A8J5JX71_HOMAM|nr:hypothetical protein Hamer_G007286 [Homarus americanus]
MKYLTNTAATPYTHRYPSSLLLPKLSPPPLPQIKNPGSSSLHYLLPPPVSQDLNTETTMVTPPTG